MAIPAICQSPTTCYGRTVGRFGDTWLCRPCLDYTEKHRRLPPADPLETAAPEIAMPTNHDRILAYLQTHPVTFNTALQDALGIKKGSVSSAVDTLRRRGLVAPSDGSGTVRLIVNGAPASTPAPDPQEDPEEMLWPAPAPVPAPEPVAAPKPPVRHFVRAKTGLQYDVSSTAEIDGHLKTGRFLPSDVLYAVVRANQGDYQHCIGTLAKTRPRWAALFGESPAATPEPAPAEDHVETSEADVLRAENARLTAAYAELQAENAGMESHLRSELETAVNEIGALRAALRMVTTAADASSVRLEWRGRDLFLTIGTFSDRIAQAERHHNTWIANIFPSSHAMTATAATDAEAARIITAVFALHGLTVPPLPESA